MASDLSIALCKIFFYRILKFNYKKTEKMVKDQIGLQNESNQKSLVMVIALVAK